MKEGNMKMASAPVLLNGVVKGLNFVLDNGDIHLLFTQNIE
jgi:hypothetical protein